MSATRRTRILIVEDSPTQAASLRYLLEDRGFDAPVASNAAEALRLAGEQPPPDLILSDVIMPVTDGFTLCRRIKDDPRLRRIPVILMTALANPDDILHCLRAEADLLITKPCEEDALVARIQSTVREASAETPDQRVEFEVSNGDTKYLLSCMKRNIINLLISSYETAVLKEQALLALQKEIEALREQLAKHDD